MLREGLARCLDFQDIAYAELYLSRMQSIARLDADPAAALSSETARFLALWMCYEDVIRVADLKTRLSRHARVRAEVQAQSALSKARVQAQVALPDGKQLPLDFTPDPAVPGSYTARFDATIPGQHKVAATVIADDKNAADTLVAFDVQADGALTNQRDFGKLRGGQGGDRTLRKVDRTEDVLERHARRPMDTRRHGEHWTGRFP